MPNFFVTKSNWKIGSKIFSPYDKVHCTIDNSYKHVLKLSERNRFLAKNQTLGC